MMMINHKVNPITYWNHNTSVSRFKSKGEIFMAQEVKNEFRVFVEEEIMPELLNSTGFSREELMEKYVDLEPMDEPETFNDEVMNNYQLVVGEYRFDCYLDDELIDKFDDEDLKFKDLLEGLD